MEVTSIYRLFRHTLPTIMLSSLFLLHGDAFSFAQTARESYDKGIALYRQKKIDAALTAFEAARQQAPDNPDILNWIGFVHLQKGGYEDALEPLQRAAKLKPAGADVHLNLGNVYDGLKRYEEAESEFKTVVRLQPKSADAYHNLGNIYYKMKKLPEAVGAYRKASALDPSDPYIQDGYGFMLQANGNLNEAIAAYENATRMSPNIGSFWLNLGLARREAAQKISMAPAKLASNLKGAKAALATAASLSPNDFSIRTAYGETLFDMRRFEEAAAQFERAAQIAPKQYKPRYNLALSLMQSGRLSAAEKSLQKALEMAPDNRDVLYNLGMVLYKQAKYTQATDTFTHMTQMDAGDMTAWMYLSASQERGGNKEKAFATLQEALKQESNEPARKAAIRRTLAARLYQRGDEESLKSAQELYEASLKEAPDNADAYNGLGLIAQKQKRIEEAVRAFQQAVTLNPRFADALNNLGVALEAQGARELAIASYRKALLINANHIQAKKNLARFEKKTP